jgi:ketosteroid isomerase-like protein
MDRAGVAAWVAAYERAWRARGTDAALGLFTPDATYSQGPYREPVVGAAAIADMWDAERDGPDEVFRMSSEIVAVDGDTAVVRVEVLYGDPVDKQFRDLWVIRFAPDGRCRAFEEWWFEP